MDSFILFWNRLYFSQYNILYFFTHYILGFLLRACFYRPLYSIPLVKRRIDKLYSNYDTWIKSVNDIYENPKSGQLMFFVNAAITYVILLLFLLFFSVLYSLYGIGVRMFFFEHLKPLFVFFIAFAIIFCKIIIWKNDSYLRYFSIFEKEPLMNKIVWCIGTVFFTAILTILTIFIFRAAETENGFWS